MKETVIEYGETSFKFSFVSHLLSFDFNFRPCFQVFTWGLGHDGRLGQGSKDNLFAPNKVILSGEIVVQDIVAGPDCSAIITAANELFCCGGFHYSCQTS